jgi:predicted transcriptional regulator
MKKQNVKDLILLHLEQEERPLAWLARKSGVPYGTLYGILVHKIMNFSDDNLKKVNKAMGTDFTND